MELPHPLQQGCFLDRPNRFACNVEVEGQRLYCYLPNPGRLEELLHAGAEVWVADRRNEAERRTSHDLLLVADGDTLVSVDSRLPNDLFEEAVGNGLFPELAGWQQIRREIDYGDSRLDAMIEADSEQWLVEVKSCTLVEDGTARFPDAPTERGRRHIHELIDGRAEGYAAAVVFVVQRDDAKVFSPHAEMDSEFAGALREAVQQGVEAMAVECEVSVEQVTPVQRLPVELWG